MNIIDTHTHLFLPQFDKDRKEVLKRAIDHGVKKMILPNIDEESVEPMLNLTKEFPNNCYPTMGMHPSSINDNYNVQLDKIEKILISGKYYAIGETGIDLYWDKTYKKEQSEAFKRHISWAKKYSLPLIIHSREAVTPLINILSKKEYKDVSGVFHSFTGTAEQAKKIIKLGFKIGVGGIVTFKNAGIDKMVSQLSIDDIILETDAPYLAPVPKRGKRNESAYTIFIAEKIGEIFNISVEKVAEKTNNNAVKLFDLEYPYEI